MRFLFEMPFPGYLRYFDSVVQGLADRGHEVDLVWEKPSTQAEGLLAVAGYESIRSHELPKRDDFWRFSAKRARIIANWVRFLDRRFADSEYLRQRAASRIIWPLNSFKTLPDWLVRRLLDLAVALEAAVPRSPILDAFLAQLAPDAVIVTPLVKGATPQNDVLASARGQGYPTAGAIASWDNLTNKSIVLVQPDRMLVWNETQRREAVELHRYPADRVVVTGAQCFDRWFERRPSRSRAEFCEQVGLPADGPFLLFVGSTASISAPDAEAKFVHRWLSFLGSDPDLSGLAVLIRPHPYNSMHWEDVDLSEFSNVRIWPSAGANPVDEDDRADYFDSLYHAGAVVGINTSAMIEAAIVGRPVLTLGVDELQEAQRGTLHFSYLLPENGGFVRAAGSFDEHADQLKDVLADEAGVQAGLTAFVQSFVRPAGLETPATPIFVTALEDLARREPEPFITPSLSVVPLRAVLILLGLPELPRVARRRLGAIKAWRARRARTARWARHDREERQKAARAARAKAARAAGRRTPVRQVAARAKRVGKRKR